MDRPQRPNRQDYRGNPAGFQLAMQSYRSAMDLWREEQRGQRWTPASSQNPDAGVIAGTDDVVSFKTKGDRTIIADGDYSEGDGTGAKEARDAFDGTRGDRGHNDYGPKAEGGGYFAEDRHKFTGPGH